LLRAREVCGRRRVDAAKDNAVVLGASPTYINATQTDKACDKGKRTLSSFALCYVQDMALLSLESLSCVVTWPLSYRCVFRTVFLTLRHGREKIFGLGTCVGAEWLFGCDGMVRWQDSDTSDCGLRLSEHRPFHAMREGAVVMLCSRGPLFGEICLPTHLGRTDW
jgi:hypothetical protein